MAHHHTNPSKATKSKHPMRLPPVPFRFPFGYPPIEAPVISSQNIRKALEDSDRRDFQRMEFIGDAWLAAFVNTILSSELPDSSPGELCWVKDCIIRNEQLAYFTEYLQLARLTNHKLLPGIKRGADLFEAYLSALIYEKGLEFAYEWVKELAEPSITWYFVQYPNNLKKWRNNAEKLHELLHTYQQILTSPTGSALDRVQALADITKGEVAGRLTDAREQLSSKKQESSDSSRRTNTKFENSSGGSSQTWGNFLDSPPPTSSSLGAKAGAGPNTPTLSNQRIHQSDKPSPATGVKPSQQNESKKEHMPPINTPIRSSFHQIVDSFNKKETQAPSEDAQDATGAPSQASLASSRLNETGFYAPDYGVQDTSFQGSSESGTETGNPFRSPFR